MCYLSIVDLKDRKGLWKIQDIWVMQFKRISILRNKWNKYKLNIDF